jgi:hypothetical protein
MASDYSWIYLAIFLIIPLSRIIPRLLAKKRMKNNTSEIIQEKQIQPSFDKYSREPQREFSKPQREFSKPQTKNMLVLGELNRGSKTFESIQKNTDLDNKELKNGMLKVHQKQGLLGPRIELYLTDKGFKEYNS